MESGTELCNSMACAQRLRVAAALMHEAAAADAASAEPACPIF